MGKLATSGSPRKKTRCSDPACAEKGGAGAVTEAGEWRQGALAATITRARSHQADALYADMDSYVARMLEGEIDHHTARVAIWARQWQAARMNPRRYGDRIEAKLSIRNYSI